MAGVIARFAPRGLPPGMSRWWRPMLVALLVVATIAVLAWTVFPTRTWLSQRAAIADRRVELQALEAQRQALDDHRSLLEDDAHVEALARAEYGLVAPGEEAYAVLEPPVEPIVLPDLWPFGTVVADETDESSSSAGG